VNYLSPLDEPEGISEKRDALCSQNGVKETDEIADLLFLFVPHKWCLIQTILGQFQHKKHLGSCRVGPTVNQERDPEGSLSTHVRGFSLTFESVRGRER
jgi:hypothetical protein